MATQLLRPFFFFKPVAIGLSIGSAVLFAPLLFIIIPSLLINHPQGASPWLLLLFLPVFLVLQALWVALIVVLGLWVFSRFRPLSFSAGDEHP